MTFRTLRSPNVGGLALCALALTGCGSKDSGDSGPHTGSGAGVSTGTPTGGTTECGGELTHSIMWTDVDGAPPSDTDGDGDNDVNCSSDTVDIDVCDPLGVGTWRFGWAEVGASGWTGEDCLNGYAGHNICHQTTDSELTLTEVCTPGEVIPSQTTLLDHSKDPFLTYYIDDQGDCFVFGNDPSYYDTLGCEVLM